MRNMTLWSAAGISIAAAAVSTSGGETVETLKWLADLCLTGAIEGEMPMIAMQEHAPAPSPSVAMGLGLIAAAMIMAGIWPGEPPDTGTPLADPDKMLAAMTHVAGATGGISPPELAAQVTEATGMELSVTEAALALRSYRAEAEDDELAWIAEGETLVGQDMIMKAALRVGWTHGEFTPGGLEMIGQLARAFGLSGDDLALLFWDVTETPLHKRDDPFTKLRPKSKVLRGQGPAMA